MEFEENKVTDEENQHQVTVEIRNKVEIIGILDSDIVLHHETRNEGIFSSTVKVPRLNDSVYDFINLEIPERVTNLDGFSKGDQVYIKGQFRSFNKKNDSGHTSLVLSVFVEEIEHDSSSDKLNNIRLVGRICKKPNLRKTPSGRYIADIIVAASRNYSRSDYIPCIVWGRDARYVASELDAGSFVYVEGRVQSRTYKKRISDTDYENRTAYEVSVLSLQNINEDEKVVEIYTE